MSVMNPLTRQRWLSYLNNQAQLNGAVREGSYLEMTVDPAVQQKLEKAKMESSPLLGKINSFGVTDQEGEKVSVAVRGPVAGVHTSTEKRRQPRSMHTLSADRYRCERVNYDTFISYTQLDAWNGRHNFQALVSQQIMQQEANDRLMVGFNGTHYRDPSDFEANPLLQDVGKGWLQHIREKAPERVMDGITLSRYDEDGKRLEKGLYGNPDALVYDAVTSVLDPWHREAPGLVAIVGRAITTQKNFRILNDHHPFAPNLETLAGNELVKLSTLGGVPVFHVPFFPDGAILITTFKNLSVYWMKGRYARRIVNEPEYNRITTYADSVEGYAVEDYGLSCLIENITHAGADRDEETVPEKDEKDNPAQEEIPADNDKPEV